MRADEIDMKPETYSSGLNRLTSIGNNGRYRLFAAAQQFRLATAVWKDGIVRQPGTAGKTHFQLDLPESYSVRTHDQSWTGRRLSYTWGDGEGVELHLRSTLPGARLVALGRSVHLRWGDNLPDGLTAIDAGGAQMKLVNHPDLSPHRFLIGNCRICPVLIVLSDSLERISVTAHAHWEFVFRSPGAAMFVVPLLKPDQLPLTPETQSIWQSLLNRPPVQCEESYRIKGDALHIHSEFPNAQYAPIPPLLAQADPMRGLLELPDRGTVLIDTLLGPYSVVAGDSWDAKVDLQWTRARVKSAKAVTGRLSPLPEELVYPGDWSWDPERLPMDKLLALRTWAPMVDLLPAELKSQLVSQLIPPTPDDFRQSLHTIREPVSGIEWSKDRGLFENKGDCSWDPDWYNGLSLSGLERAIRCGVEAIAAPARKLADECKPERDRMLKYFEVFHDWSLWAAWTDARGLFWLPDCCHNGLEGLLAESRLRRDGGDAAAADRLLYLAGKTAACLISLFTLPDWCNHSGFIMPSVEHNGFLKPGESGQQAFGVNAIIDAEGIATITEETKNPYCLAGNFPEYAALLKRHGPVDRLRELARLWAAKHPDRYRDWIAFYIGSDPQQIARRKANLEQEAKDQAAVFYHLAPEISLRQWVLGEQAEEIESRYKTPLNLVEQVWLRSHSVLEIPERMHS